ncbi:CaiB/BaiF CoA transferase family protein [Rhabdothermincola sp.]|uniref:CaiB/BaiF CoA transferase family protein n=1 Tax=Rhabdothermincola sp. TaxID=2820405 RepID=UPI002FE423E8
MLENYRVVELGVWVAGPSAGGILADWGADVIKVEPPEGDPMRRVFQLIAGHGRTESPPFDLDNRGKRSVVLDLKHEADRQRLHALVRTADVFLTNLRAGALERLGFGPDALLAENPHLVYALVTGYGLEGPDATRPGYDVGGFWARTGIAATLAAGDTPPPNIRGGFGDHVTGLATLSGILGALLERERTGKGQLVETSLLRTGVYCLGWDLGIQLRFGKLAGPVARTEEMNPLVNCYRAGDGRWFWLLGVESQRHFPNLCRSIGREDLIDDERFADGRARRHHAVELIAILDEAFAASSRDEIAAAFDAHGVWWAPVLTPEEVVEDPQAIAAGAFVEVPEGGGAPAHRAVASPVTFHGGGVPPVGPVPGLGEHTAQVIGSRGGGEGVET